MLGFTDNPDRPLSPGQAGALLAIGEQSPSIRLDVLGTNAHTGAVMMQASEVVRCDDGFDTRYALHDQGWFILTATGRPMLHDGATYQLREMPEGLVISPARAAIILNTRGELPHDAGEMLSRDGLAR